MHFKATEVLGNRLNTSLARRQKALSGCKGNGGHLGIIKGKTMDKMELKYLCGYLSYELRIKWGERIIKMNTGQGSSRYWIGISSLLKWYNSDMIEKPVPLLLPLSDLTEPEYQSVFDEFSEVESDDLFERLQFAGKGLIPYSKVCDKLSFEIINILFKNHFDIYGLIPTGLALDKRNFKI